jgi:hypothetical protein
MAEDADCDAGKGRTVQRAEVAAEDGGPCRGDRAGRDARLDRHRAGVEEGDRVGEAGRDAERRRRCQRGRIRRDADIGERSGVERRERRVAEGGCVGLHHDGIDAWRGIQLVRCTACIRAGGSVWMAATGACRRDEDHDPKGQPPLQEHDPGSHRPGTESRRMWSSASL